MLGELAIAEGRFDEATPFLDRALALHPGLSVTRMMRGMNRLRLGQFRAGWADYAAREAGSPSFTPAGRRCPRIRRGAARIWPAKPCW